MTRITCRARSADGIDESMRRRQCWVSRTFRSGRHPSTRLRCVFLIIVPLFAAAILSVTSSHPHIAPNPNTASLFCDHPAKRRAFSEARELLRAEHNEWHRLDFHAVRYMRLASRVCRGCVTGLIIILFILQFFVQAEAEPVHAFMPH